MKVKFLTMGTADDEEEAEEEEEQRVTDVDEDGQVTLDGGTGKEKVGPLKVMVMGEDKLPTDFLSKLLNDLYYVCPIIIFADLCHSITSQKLVSHTKIKCRFPY